MAQFYFNSVIGSNEFLYDTAAWSKSSTHQYFKKMDGKYSIELTTDYLAEYLLSLSFAMKDHAELREKASYLFSCTSVSDHAIAFFSSVIYKVGKPRYFSEQLEKISGVKSKIHDRRFEVIDDPAMDGSILSVYRFCIGSFSSNSSNSWERTGFERYVIAKNIYDWFYKNKPRRYFFDGTHPAIIAGLVSNEDEARCIDVAYDTGVDVIAGFNAFKRAEDRVDTFKKVRMRYILEN
jgi:hypothetical protein